MATSVDMEEITLIDKTNQEFKVIVSSNDATKARNDLTFATQLLQHARNSQQIDCTLQQASTSSNSNSGQQESVVSDTMECSEGTHAWTKEGTLLLLELYCENQTKFVGGKGIMKKQWDRIANLMQEKGYKITGFKCATKFQSLKRTYKCITDHNKKSGNNRKDWEFLQIMQELFGEKPWMQPLSIAGSHLDEIQDNNIEDKENPRENVTKTKKLNTLINDYISFSKEERVKWREMRAKQHEEKLLAFKKMENLLEKLINKENKSEN